MSEKFLDQEAKKIYETNRFNFTDIEDSFIKDFISKGSPGGINLFTKQYFTGFYKRHPLEVARRVIEL